jgi:hypothetical protein
VFHDDRTEPQHGVERDDMLRAVREDQRDAIAGRDAQASQALGCPGDPVSEFAIRGDRSEELQCGPTRVAADGVIEHVDEGLRDRFDLGGHPGA